MKSKFLILQKMVLYFDPNPKRDHSVKNYAEYSTVVHFKRGTLTASSMVLEPIGAVLNTYCSVMLKGIPRSLRAIF